VKTLRDISRHET